MGRNLWSFLRLGGLGRRSILRRTALLTWTVVLVVLALFTGFILTYQRGILVDQLSSTAQIVATSIDQVTVTSIVVEDYSPVIEHCLKVVRERPMVRYLIIQRKDGFALVHWAGGWRAERLDDRWTALRFLRGDFVDSELIGEEVFHYSYPLGYSGIDWGWIYIGLSLDRYKADLRVIYTRTILLALLCMLAAFTISLFFARRVSQPIQELNRLTQQVAAGDLAARLDLATGDEVESLARSFNRMTEALKKARDELEVRVEERTAELKTANEHLRAEIEERQRAEAARRIAEQRLEEQRTLRMRSDRLRALGEMAANIAHELNQPLVGVRGLAEYLLIGLEQGWRQEDEILRQHLEGIVAQADRMVHIIEHVRKFAREAGQPSLSAVRIEEVVQSAMALIGVQFRFHGLPVELDLADGLPAVWANPFSLEQVLLNLLTNARDAVEEKRRLEAQWRGQVLVRTGPAESGVRLEVSDNGVGIPVELQDRVFDPFFTTKEPGQGTGLGLAISKAIVEEFGGRLWLSSAPGQGTTVVVDLPASPQKLSENPL